MLAGLNTLEWVVHYLAVLGMGAIATPDDTRLSATQLTQQATLLDRAARSWSMTGKRSSPPLVPKARVPLS